MAKFLILWRASDKPTLLEHEEYDTREEADAELAEFKTKYPWNTYTLVAVEAVEVGTGENPTLPKFTVVG